MSFEGGNRWATQYLMSVGLDFALKWQEADIAVAQAMSPMIVNTSGQDDCLVSYRLSAVINIKLNRILEKCLQ